MNSDWISVMIEGDAVAINLRKLAYIRPAGPDEYALVFQNDSTLYVNETYAKRILERLGI